jgi:hypothetical protein
MRDGFSNDFLGKCALHSPFVQKNGHFFTNSVFHCLKIPKPIYYGNVRNFLFIIVKEYI